MTFQSLSGLMWRWEPEWCFICGGKFALRNGPWEERGEAWTAEVDGDGDLDNNNTVGGK